MLREEGQERTEYWAQSGHVSLFHSHRDALVATGLPGSTVEILVRAASNGHHVSGVTRALGTRSPVEGSVCPKCSPKSLPKCRSTAPRPDWASLGHMRDARGIVGGLRSRPPRILACVAATGSGILTPVPLSVLAQGRRFPPSSLAVAAASAPPPCAAEGKSEREERRFWGWTDLAWVRSPLGQFRRTRPWAGDRKLC